MIVSSLKRFWLVFSNPLNNFQLSTFNFQLNTRTWRNWQTRWFQVPVKQFMWVQVPSPAPNEKTESLWLCLFRFCGVGDEDAKPLPRQSEVLCFCKVSAEGEICRFAFANVGHVIRATRRISKRSPLSVLCERRVLSP